MSYLLSELAIYPIKSIHGIKSTRAEVLFSGLKNDRRYMLVKPNGDFITGRKYPQLTQINAQVLPNNGLELSHPETENKLILNPNDFPQTYRDVTIWGNDISAQSVGEAASLWFQALLSIEAELVFFGESSQRFTSRRPDSPVGFADGYPFLLTTEASLEELNRTCPEHIRMAQFRPNIVIKGNDAFAEDTWKRIRIGEVEFENIKPCVRCIFTTIDPDNAERSKLGEPLKTLAKFRKLKNAGITFGINMVALNQGMIQQGDEVEILEYQAADSYEDKR
ncbi:MOSC domain-containing protein [Marinomonas sp. TW1]|uniref:MOSC domain-containing protein n=1 Tax=Marinomonas sp. TW1 TaxID=1561203 RepID=UPI0007AFAE42|nr:MOSC domain-containing protein [Marinomonas sp. TW1]KZN13142.1 sulfurase [Marinomonas sp. TW1]